VGIVSFQQVKPCGKRDRPVQTRLLDSVVVYEGFHFSDFLVDVPVDLRVSRIEMKLSISGRVPSIWNANLNERQLGRIPQIYAWISGPFPIKKCKKRFRETSVDQC
jgi:hypothetical protein